MVIAFSADRKGRDFDTLSAGANMHTVQHPSGIGLKQDQDRFSAMIYCP